ncbi:urea carboxylase [Pestalotiopsis fici W106-1]|uniref:Urea carboxylase n=1 Tax=Pestalotiopsis fici (strain W106-1 / CGMCC3.15140) TaxID=1229662 RepID=W3XLE3_PESFW|nr:urea carboxylase [Pestalotiopsis fici W106-1]ETS86272.1 urea carboxylase [Pestalotiopsis fici W106-1]
MDSLRSVLVANRGEIACRLIRGARELQIKTIAIYTDVDAESQHVIAADEAQLLSGDASTAYLDGQLLMSDDREQIISIAKQKGAQAIIPGYGFLSENAEFVRLVVAAGLTFVGPSAETIEMMGLKHTARELAVEAGVPVIPGSKGLLESAGDAVTAAQKLGFPVMLKATAGGGGMGLMVCQNEQDVKQSFEQVQSRGTTLFKNSGVFLEKYYPDSRHIEVQIFGNAQGHVISIGERECSIQRRHQKVIEECPSPFVERNPSLRQKLTKDAISLGERISYGSAGTVEYLVDDHTGNHYFLEMNTRLQVEHGVTEMCYAVDLVHLMLKQADRQLGGSGGLDAQELSNLQAQCLEPRGHAIEARVYAENPARNFAPSPGLLQQVTWELHEQSRIDTWVRSGNVISSMYDPLLAKIMHHAPSRQQAISELIKILKGSQVCGPPTNLDFLLKVVESDDFGTGSTLTRTLDTFSYVPAAIDVVAGGSQTLIQDYPGRPTVGHGFGHAGPMDPIAFRIANSLVGNSVGTEALEITLTGPELLFLGDAIIALCGPPVQASVDSTELPLWIRVRIQAGQRIKIGKLAQGCRLYLAVYGGFLNVAEWFGSKSTNPMVTVGGYQGRALRAGDFLRISAATSLAAMEPVSVPSKLLPRYQYDCWDIQVMSGPYETGYLTTEDIRMITSTEWQVSHNAARGGMRLIGPRPKFARSDGGEGGSHPSNVFEYGYPIGGLNWTGDEPVIFPVDCPDFGGFICSSTVIKADFWKLGQVRSGDRIRFRLVTLEGALECRRRNESFVEAICSAIGDGDWTIVPMFTDLPLAPETAETGFDLLHVIEATDSSPLATYRAGGDDFLLVEYGDGKPDLNHKCRATALRRSIEAMMAKSSSSKDDRLHILNMVGCGNSLMIYYDGLQLSRTRLLGILLDMEKSFGDMSMAKFPNRRFRVPVTFQHKKIDAMMERYMTNQRSKASYLPDPFEFLAANNGLTTDELKRVLLSLESVVIGVGFFMALPESLPVDPRHRLRAPKMNPSRTFTPAGTFSWGGCAIAVYPVDSPGGFMPLGMTMPGVDVYGSKDGFSETRPWMFEDMDLITYYEVSEEEYDRQMLKFRAGSYQFEYEADVFDMGAHNVLLRETQDEVQRTQERIALAQAKMAVLENKLLEEWIAEKKSNETDPGELQKLLEDPANRVIESPVNANVWKVFAQEGDIIRKGQTITILEAMEMEINVNVADDLDAATIYKTLIQPGQSVEAGQACIVVRVS